MRTPAENFVPQNQHHADLEAQFARRLTAKLTQRAQCTDTDDHVISERLRIARENAMQRAREIRKQTQPSLAESAVALGRSAVLKGDPGQSPWWMKFASVLPVLALAIGLFAIEEGQLGQQISATAEIDTALLKDTLPPAAYSDPGFSEYLNDSGE